MECVLLVNEAFIICQLDEIGEVLLAFCIERSFFKQKQVKFFNIYFNNSS